ncbi:hypothetical protein FGRMN_5537 [Fusarium graminum]|nr:hypothetical protein FGRMN_5537 [Fusarium graminum]
MKASIASALLAALAGSSLAQSPKKISTAKYDESYLHASNAPHAIGMGELRQRKLALHKSAAAAGVFDKDRYKVLSSGTSCTDGKAGEYSCNKIDLKGFLRHQDLGSRTRVGNDVWGWTHASSGREFALIGQSDGTAFAEVHKDGSLTYVGRLPTQTVASTWRDIKVIGNFAYIGSEAAGHGLQIFDLTKILNTDPKNPPTFSVSRDLAAHFSAFGSSHNIVANEDTALIAAVGTAYDLKCRAGLWMVDVSNPRRPQDAGCVSSDGYVHDAQCVIYRGPQAGYQGKEICFNYNEDALTIVDISRRTMPRQLSRTTYNGATYTHQGWLTEDHKYLLLDDELDEQEKTGPAADQHTTTYIVDIQDLQYPVFRGVYKSPVRSIDHNQYIVGGVSYQANYGSGLRMVNVSSLAQDDSGTLMEEIGHFDVHPDDDAVGGEATFFGAWSVYPYFQSGNILIMRVFLIQTARGLFSSSGGYKSNNALLGYLRSRGHTVRQLCYFNKGEIETYVRDMARNGVHDVQVRTQILTLRSEDGKSQVDVKVQELVMDDGVEIVALDSEAFHGAFSASDNPQNQMGRMTAEYIETKVPPLPLEDFVSFLQKQIRRFSPTHMMSNDGLSMQASSAAEMRDVCMSRIAVVHTAEQLPFGPFAGGLPGHSTTPREIELLRDLDGIWSVSNAIKTYAFDHGHLQTNFLVHHPWTYLTAEKHEIPRHLRNWNKRWASRRVRPTATDQKELWRDIKVLIVPSLWYEAWGMVVVEAHLRGIPVISSNAGALPEAMLGLDYIIPVNPIDGKRDKSGKYLVPDQDIRPWVKAVTRLMEDRAEYQRVSDTVYHMTAKWLQCNNMEALEEWLEGLKVTGHKF